jgi:hypothetical protein
VALGNFLGVEINFGEDAQAPDDARNRIPIHFHQILRFAGNVFRRGSDGAHMDRSFIFAAGLLTGSLA